MEKNFFKLVCEQLSPLEKEILIDKNCKDVNEVFQILESHPELMKTTNTWILYPMTLTIK